VDATGRQPVNVWRLKIAWPASTRKARFGVISYGMALTGGLRGGGPPVCLLRSQQAWPGPAVNGHGVAYIDCIRSNVVANVALLGEKEVRLGV
jgi:hypothetical protein